MTAEREACAWARTTDVSRRKEIKIRWGERRWRPRSGRYGTVRARRRLLLFHQAGTNVITNALKPLGLIRRRKRRGRFWTRGRRRRPEIRPESRDLWSRRRSASRLFVMYARARAAFRVYTRAYGETAIFFSYVSFFLFSFITIAIVIILNAAKCLSHRARLLIIILCDTSTKPMRFDLSWNETRRVAVRSRWWGCHCIHGDSIVRFRQSIVILRTETRGRREIPVK